MKIGEKSENATKEVLSWIKEKEQDLSFPASRIMLLVFGVSSDDEEDLKIKFKEDIDYLNQLIKEINVDDKLKAFLSLTELNRLCIEDLIKYGKFLRDIYSLNNDNETVKFLLEKIDNHYLRERRKN